MILKIFLKNKEGTIPLFKFLKEIIRKVHIPCTFIVCNSHTYYNKYFGKFNWL